MIISILSQKGGTGKTTVAFNLACLLSFNKKVAFVNLDRQSLIKIMIEHAENLKLDLDFFNTINSHLKEIKALNKEYDYVVLDTSPNLKETDIVNIGKLSDCFISVVTNDEVDILANQENFEYKHKNKHLIINKISNKEISSIEKDLFFLKKTYDFKEIILIKDKNTFKLSSNSCLYFNPNKSVKHHLIKTQNEFKSSIERIINHE